MSKPLVSIVMSEYNTKLEHLDESIKSILCQTFQDFEFIIIDDGGVNDVNDLVSRYDDDRLRVIENDRNRGLIYSLNRGVEESKSEYIVRMDTDDIAMPSRLKTIYDFIILNPQYDVVGSRVLEFSDNEDYGVLGLSGEKTAKSIMKGEPLIHPSVIMRKASFLRAGGYKDYKRAEDLALWCEMLLQGSRLYVVDAVMLKYRVNPEDYSKRKLRYRGGEMRARRDYYPRLGAKPIDYLRIIRFVISGVLPNSIVQKYRKKFRLTREES